jgi:hypothetical protein
LLTYEIPADEPQTIVHPLLYQVITLNNAEDVEALAARLTRLAAKDISSGKWIHTLRVHANCRSSASTVLDGLVAILLQAQCLKHLHYASFSSPLATLAASSACPTTLQSMHVCVNNPAILVHTRAFRCLRALRIRALSRLNLDDIPPLELHGIKHFTWDNLVCVSRNGSISALGYIHRCHFGRLQELELLFEGLQPADVPHMLDVLGKHKTAFLNLTINHSVCAAILPHIHAPRLGLNPLLPSLVDKISDEVTSLAMHFAGYVNLGENTGSVWQVLQAFAEGKAQTTSIQQIMISISSGRFSWYKLNPAPGYDSFVARLLRLSIPLRRRGIRLLDEDGESMHLDK